MNDKGSTTNDEFRSSSQALSSARNCLVEFRMLGGNIAPLGGIVHDVEQLGLAPAVMTSLN